MATFTKNKQTGNFDVIGTQEEMHEGTVKVTKKDGTTKDVAIVRLSKPFEAKFGSLKGKMVCIGTVGRQCVACGVVQQCDSRGYPNVKIYRSGECQDCYEERKMGY